MSERIGMPVGACRQLVGSSSECPSESVGSLSAACRQPVGSLSGGPVGPCRGGCGSLSEPVGACRSRRSLSEPVGPCRGACRSATKYFSQGKNTLWNFAAPQSIFPRGKILCERHKVFFPREKYFAKYFSQGKSKTATRSCH